MDLELKLNCWGGGGVGGWFWCSGGDCERRCRGEKRRHIDEERRRRDCWDWDGDGDGESEDGMLLYNIVLVWRVNWIGGVAVSDWNYLLSSTFVPGYYSERECER